MLSNFLFLIGPNVSRENGHKNLGNNFTIAFLAKIFVLRSPQEIRKEALKMSVCSYFIVVVV